MTRLRLTIVAALMLVVWAEAAAAQSFQSIRVVSANAAVRVSAGDDSPVILTPPVGSDFELTRTDGQWHVVLLPADAQGLRRYGYIRTREAVLVRASPASAPAAPALAPAPASAPASGASGATGLAAVSPPAPDWNQRFRAAEARRSAGRAKFWGGMGALAGGAAILTAITMKMVNSKGPNGECSDRNPCYEYAWGAGGAVGLFVTGRVLISGGRRQAAAANAEIIQLKTEQANARPMARLVIPLGEGARSRGAVVLQGGQGLQAQYQVQW